MKIWNFPDLVRTYTFVSYFPLLGSMLFQQYFSCVVEVSYPNHVPRSLNLYLTKHVIHHFSICNRDGEHSPFPPPPPTHTNTKNVTAQAQGGTYDFCDGNLVLLSTDPWSQSSKKLAVTSTACPHPRQLTFTYTASCPVPLLLIGCTVTDQTWSLMWQMKQVMSNQWILNLKWVSENTVLM